MLHVECVGFKPQPSVIRDFKNYKISVNIVVIYVGNTLSPSKIKFWYHNEVGICQVVL